VLHRARSRRRLLIRLAPCVALVSLLAAAPVAGGLAEEPGDVFFEVENDDLHADRFGAGVTWLQPTLSWLDVELGGRYGEFDEASWGVGAVGAHLRLPAELGFASLRYEAGAGDGESGAYTHQIGEVSFTRALWRKRVFGEVGLQRIRVGDTEDDLGRLGLALAPNDWLQMHAGYLHSVFNGRDTDGWSGGTRLRLGGSTLFAGYARTRDTVDLRSIGRGLVQGEEADEYSAGITLPLGPHGTTLAATRYEGADDTRHTLSLAFRWSLSAPPWRLDPASDDVAANDASYEPAATPTSGPGEPEPGTRRFLSRFR
jgi:hypothetical protein